MHSEIALAIFFLTMVIGYVFLCLKEPLKMNIKNKKLKQIQEIMSHPAVIFILCIFLVWGVFVILQTKDSFNYDQFGDSFGGLTSLFTGLAFAGLLITIQQQREDINLTKQEMKDHQFENILFKMIDVYNDILRDIDLRRKEDKEDRVVSTGRDCFKSFVKEDIMQFIQDECDTNNTSVSACDREALLKQAYEEFWGKRRKDLGHYFRYLYNIFKYIDESEQSSENKNKFAKIVRSQLSDYELVMLYFNGISQYGQKFKILIEKYTLLDNLPYELTIIERYPSLTFKDLYNESAFGDNKEFDN
jgi:hypothetical protein